MVRHEVVKRNRDYDHESTFRCNVNAPAGDNGRQTTSPFPLLLAISPASPPLSLPWNADSCEKECKNLARTSLPVSIDSVDLVGLSGG